MFWESSVMNLLNLSGSFLRLSSETPMSIALSEQSQQVPLLNKSVRSQQSQIPILFLPQFSERGLESTNLIILLGYDSILFSEILLKGRDDFGESINLTTG